MNQLMPAVLAHDADAWALRINGRWRASVENIIEAGQLLIDAKGQLPHGTFEAMLRDKLDFNPSVAQRLMIIARDNRLKNPAHAQLLPRSWTTLYELTKLSDEEFNRGIEGGIIGPEMERKDVELIRPMPHRVLESSTAVVQDAVNVPVAGSIPASPANDTDTGEPAGRHHLSNAEMDGAGDTPLTAGSPVSAPMPNGARAIAPSRHEPDDSLDFFPTPPWATRALFEHVLVHLERKGHCQFQRAWEPACGEGHMAEVMCEYFRDVLATDKGDYAYRHYGLDFLNQQMETPGAYDWIITNPPFGDKTEAFVLKAIELASTGVAMFVRLQWLESVGRYERIFRDKPPTLIAFFAERVPLHKARWEPEGDTLTAYIWLVWIKGAAPQAPFWIPPGCRERLSKAEDVKRFGKMAAQGEAA